MNLEQVESLFDKFCDSELASFELEFENAHLKMTRPSAHPPIMFPSEGFALQGAGKADAAVLSPGGDLEGIPLTNVVRGTAAPADSRDQAGGSRQTASRTPAGTPAPSPSASSEDSQGSSSAASGDRALENVTFVRAPLVGVFYSAPSPTSEPYVKVGQKVHAGQVLCLIEAMKLMNEIKAPVDGTVVAIDVENGAMVAFDDVIMEIAE